MPAQVANLTLLEKLVCCPNCLAANKNGFNLTDLKCSRCNSDFFLMDETPCLFPTGIYQKIIWQHQTAILLGNAEQGLNSIRESLGRYDISDATRERLASIYHANLINFENIHSLLAKKSIVPQFQEQLNNINAGDLGEYFDLLFRDWAWDSVSSPSDENKNALARIISLISQLPKTPKKILVLGAGAGRLSWDLHVHLKPEFTVAIDSNPLLIAAAEELVKQQNTIQLGEFKFFPQIDLPVTNTRSISPPENAALYADNWFLLAANVWSLPLQRNSFDLVLTPWFIDVNGGDIRDLIGIIHNLLVPDGSWLNTGPLLFTRHLPVQLKYSSDEIKEFIELTGMQILNERVDQVPYLISPMEARCREEQVWSFITQFASTKGQPTSGVTHPWLVMHHLAIPALPPSTKLQHPLIDIILTLVDGNRSINDICAEIAGKIPEGIAVKDAVVTLVGELTLELQL